MQYKKVHHSVSTSLHLLSINTPTDCYKQQCFANVLRAAKRM